MHTVGNRNAPPVINTIAEKIISTVLDTMSELLNILRLYREVHISSEKTMPARVSNGKVFPGSTCTTLPSASSMSPIISSLIPGACLPFSVSI